MKVFGGRFVNFSIVGFFIKGTKSCGGGHRVVPRFPVVKLAKAIGR